MYGMKRPAYTISRAVCRSAKRKAQNKKGKKFESKVIAYCRYGVFKLHLCPPLQNAAPKDTNAKKGMSIIMNYNAENRTPCDRIGEELFSHAGQMPSQHYGKQEIRTTSSPSLSTQAASCPMGRASMPRQSGCTCSRGDGSSSCPGRTSGRCRVHGEDQLAGLPLAMAYVPMQQWRNLYDLENGFERGTLFKELDFPFYPTACPRKGCR